MRIIRTAVVVASLAAVALLTPASASAAPKSGYTWGSASTGYTWGAAQTGYTWGK